MPHNQLRIIRRPTCLLPTSLWLLTSEVPLVLMFPLFYPFFFLSLTLSLRSHLPSAVLLFCIFFHGVLLIPASCCVEPSTILPPVRGAVLNKTSDHTSFPGGFLSSATHFLIELAKWCSCLDLRGSCCPLCGNHDTPIVSCLSTSLFCCFCRL